jgi:hypothetical protein
MKVVDQQNLATGALYLGVGVVVAIAASQHQIGSLARMGPGYFPFAAGVALGVVGVSLIAAALSRSTTASTTGSWSVKRLSIVLTSIVLFGLLVERMGLVIAVPALVSLSSRAHPQFSWRSLGISIGVLLLLTWAIFVKLLGLPFTMLPPFLTT